MGTGFESIENPLKANESEPLSVSDNTANASEQWEECKIIKYSETEYRIVCYNKSRKHKTSGDKTDKKTSASSSQKGLHEPTEQEKDRKLHENRETLYGYLTANQWDYRVVFYDVQKKNIATFSDAVRQHCKNKGYKLQYVHVPVDIADGGFYVVSAVSGVPVDVLQSIPFCKCVVQTFISEYSQDAKEIREYIQYRQNQRGFIASQKLNDPEEIIIKNPKCYAGDITTQLYSVSTVSSLDGAMYFVNEGEHMAKTHEQLFDDFKSRIKNMMKDGRKYKYVALNLLYKDNIANGEKADDNLSFHDGILPERNVNVIDRILNKQKEDFFSVRHSKNGYVMKNEICTNIKQQYIDYWINDTFPVLYIISRKSDGMVFYVGLTYEPLNRYVYHFGISENEYWGKPMTKETDSKFYAVVSESENMDFSDFSIKYIPMHTYFDGDTVKPYLHSRHNLAVDFGAFQGEFLRDGEKAEAYLQTLLLEMERDGLIKIYRKNDGNTLFEADEIREKRANEYKKMFVEKGVDPVAVCLNMATDHERKEDKYGLQEMYDLLRKREIDFYSDLQMDKAVEFVERVWERKAELLGLKK